MEKQPDITPSKNETPAKKKPVFLSIALIIILGFVAYGNSLNGQFIWDDKFLIEENTYIKNFSHIPRLFTQDIGAGAGKEWNSYRPVQMITYVVDYSLWKLNVKGYHITNILIHILAALSIYCLINIIFNDNLLSLLTGSFFVVHPIHTEAVAYISGRADPLVLLFILLSFLLYIKDFPPKNMIVYILMLLSFMAALLSRENSLILPVLLLLYQYSFKKGLKAKKFLSIASLALIYILLRVTVLKDLLTRASYTTTLFERLPGFFVAITNYLRLLFLPFDLHMEYGIELFDLGDSKAILGAVILLTLTIYAFRKKDNNRLVFFSIAWFLVTLLPVSNLYPINAYMAEHWLYLPSIGFFLIVAKAISSLYRTNNFRILAIFIALCSLTFYSYLTIRQNAYWEEPISFYKRTLKYAPNSSRVYLSLGLAYHSINKNEEAIISHKKAIEIKPNYEEAYHGLGIAYADLNKNEDAIASYKKAAEIEPDYAQVYYNLGIVYNNMGRREEAVTSYKKAIEIDPDYAEAYNNLGIVYYAMDRREDAITSYKKAVEIDPDYAEAYNNLGIVYDTMNGREESVTSYERAVEIDPDNAKAHNNLGTIYYSMGRKEDAIASYKKATEIDPDFSETYINLGIVYAALNNYEEAIASYKKAIGIKADNALAYNDLGNIYVAMNRIEEAVASYKKAMEIKSDYAKAYYNLGNVYLKLDKKEEAAALFKQAIEINPDYAMAYNNLSAIYFEKRQFKPAIEYSDKAKELGYVNNALLEALKPYR